MPIPTPTTKAAMSIRIPTAEDIAAIRALCNGEDPTMKLVEDLVPGDGFAARGRVYEVTHFPVKYGHVGIVTVMTTRWPSVAIEFTTGRVVPTYRARTVNYGLARCPSCSCNVGRDHQFNSNECNQDRLERARSRRD